MLINVVISGRSYHLASEVPSQVELPEGATIDDALEQLRELMPQENALPASCLIAVSGLHLGTVAQHPAQMLKEGDELVLISPVAGG